MDQNTNTVAEFKDEATAVWVCQLKDIAYAAAKLIDIDFHIERGTPEEQNLAKALAALRESFGLNEKGGE